MTDLGCHHSQIPKLLSFSNFSQPVPFHYPLHETRTVNNTCTWPLNRLQATCSRPCGQECWTLLRLPVSALTVLSVLRLVGKTKLLAASRRWRLLLLCRCFFVAHRNAFFGFGIVVIEAGFLLYPAPHPTHDYLIGCMRFLTHLVILADLLTPLCFLNTHIHQSWHCLLLSPLHTTPPLSNRPPWLHTSLSVVTQFVSHL